MHDWAVRPWDWNSHLIVLGDFNLDRIGVPLCEAFIFTHLRPPTELNAILRAIFDDDKTKHFSDQLAWFSKPDGTCRQQGLSYGQRAGTLRLNSARLPGPEPQRSVLVDLGSLPAVV